VVTQLFQWIPAARSPRLLRISPATARRRAGIPEGKVTTPTLAPKRWRFRKVQVEEYDVRPCLPRVAISRAVLVERQRREELLRLAAEAVIKAREDLLRALEDDPRLHHLLEGASLLFHLNHHAHGLNQWWDERETVARHALFRMKKDVMERIVTLYPDRVQLARVARGDRVWLCATCRAHAHAAGISPKEYSRTIGGCKNCERDPGYYDLVEVRVDCRVTNHCFHAPASEAGGLGDVAKLPVRNGDAADSFGRAPLPEEALAFPLEYVTESLIRWMHQNP
jgi:hypothetical protein